jgi:hypothetical protein
MFHVKHFRRPFVGKNFTVDLGSLRNALPQAARQQARYPPDHRTQFDRAASNGAVSKS